MQFEEILAKFPDAKQQGDEYIARCSAHDDSTPSLSLKRGDNGGTVLKCHAGCKTESVVASVGLSMADLMPPRDDSGRGPRKRKGFGSAIAAMLWGDKKRGVGSDSYPYWDASHKTLLGVILRWNRPDGKKEIRPIAPTKDGWQFVKMKKPWPLYWLPEISSADVVTFHEGEKAAEAARSLGFVATTSPHGAKCAPFADVSPLAGKTVVFFPDNDSPGELFISTHIARCSKLEPQPVLKIVRLPGLEEGGDVFDWIELQRKNEPAVSDEELRGRIQSMINEAKPVTAEDVTAAAESLPAAKLPGVLLPGGSRKISDAAAEIGKLLAESGKFYSRGGLPVRATAKDKDSALHLEPMKPSSACSDFEKVAQLLTLQKIEGELEEVPTICREQQARQIIDASDFRDALPRIVVLSPSPVLVERDGKLITVTGYDAPSGVWASGNVPLDMSLDQARKLLNELVADFDFSTDGDHSRALASFITPALAFGNLLGGRAPIDLGEANESQAGKGYRAKLVASVYGTVPKSVTQKKSNSGSMEESFDKHLISGATFISWDNLKGTIDYPSLESYMTEETYLARIPYSPPVEIDPRRTIICATTNKAQLTIDLANRSSVVRIRKRPDDFAYRQYPEGSIEQHLAANRSKFLGAVFRIVREWHSRGKPAIGRADHDFRRWACVLGWIVENILGAAPLMSGHREVQRRTATPALNWLRDVAIEVRKQRQSGIMLRANALLEIISNSGIETRGISADANLEDASQFENACRVIGRAMSNAFGKEAEKVEIDGMEIRREKTIDDRGREKWTYGVFDPTSPNAPENAPNEKPAFPQCPNTPEPFLEIDSTSDEESSNSAFRTFGPIGGIGGALGETPAVKKCCHNEKKFHEQRGEKIFCNVCGGYIGRVAREAIQEEVTSGF